MTIGFIDAHRDRFPMAAMCRVLEFPECTFYAARPLGFRRVAVIRAGARGYVTKTIDAEQLVDAIRRVHGGDAAFSPRLAGFVLDASSGSVAAPTDPELDQLSAREQEVMRLIARGYTYREDVAQLHLSVKTVETHASAVLRKPQLSNRQELTAWATDRRLFEDGPSGQLVPVPAAK